jgi:LysR family transcriptional regulator, cyn operon transcriptional activator
MLQFYRIYIATRSARGIELVELRQLQLLLTVIESGGYAPAGKLLHISHSAIHRQIRILEQELDCHLLTRCGSRVKATEPGRVLAELAVRIDKEIAEAQRQVSDLNNLRVGHLRIGTGSSILVSFLPAVLQRFSKKFPSIHFHLITGMADDLIEDVLKGKLDLGILFNPADFSRPVPELEIEVLYREEFDWAVGIGHPLAAQDQVTLPQLAAYPLITLPPQSHLRRACDRLFAANGLIPTVITELENEEAVDKLIEINMSFALRSRRRPANPKIRCFRIPSGTVQCEVGIVLQKTNRVPHATAEFIRICRDVRMPSRS